MTPAEYAAAFADATPPMTPPKALLEAERCPYCSDAPCAPARPPGLGAAARRAWTAVVDPGAKAIARLAIRDEMGRI